MSIFKKIAGVFMGSDDDTDEDQNEENEETVETEDDEDVSVNANEEPKPVSTPKSVEMKLMKATAYDGSVMQIADHLIKKRTVILSLDGASREAARRILDFLGGVVYTIGGQLKGVGSSTYIITPSNVDVSNDSIRNIAKGSEDGFSQSSSNGDITAF